MGVYARIGAVLKLQFPDSLRCKMTARPDFRKRSGQAADLFRNRRVPEQVYYTENQAERQDFPGFLPELPHSV
jgi:hypothetical protein